jgi:hypothetical protein
MNMKTLPITEVRSLLVAVSEHGKQHLDEVEADLSQTAYLLTKAIEKLGASFMAVHHALANQQKLLNALMQQHHFVMDDTKQVNVYNEIIDKEVSAVITGLQFQDITSQLIARAIIRVRGLKELLQQLETHGDEIEPDFEHSEFAMLLEKISDGLHTGSHALSGGLRRSVEQQNMASGEIELF